MDQSREASWKKDYGFLDDVVNSTAKRSEGRGRALPAPTRCEQTSALPYSSQPHSPMYLLVYFMGDESGSFFQLRHADGPDPERHLGGKARPLGLDAEGCAGPQREG